MKSQKTISSIGLFLIFLILSIPFYSANTLAASVQITRNTGNNGVSNFIDGNGDTWVVDAVIRDAFTEVTTDDVSLRIGRNQQPFTSCTGNALETTCTYSSPLADGVNEGTFRFEVGYTFLNSLNQEENITALGDVNVDRSNPRVTLNRIEQRNNNQMFFDFTVTDQVASGRPFVGLKEIQIIDVDSSAVAFTINGQNGLTLGSASFNFLTDGPSQGILPLSLQGDGIRTFRIVAEDQLGHRGEARKSVSTDFVAPDIRSFNFTKLKTFLGSEPIVSDMDVFIVEKNSLQPAIVLALSNQISDLADKPATTCQKIDRDLDLWRCTWDDVLVQGEQNLEVSLKATDNFGNKAEKTLGLSFTADTSPPQILSFETERTFGGASYVKANANRFGNNRILLRVAEQGAGILPEDIRLDLSAFGLGNSFPPDLQHCSATQQGLDCFWDIGSPSSTGEVLISFARFQDKVGNKGQAQELRARVDASPPRIWDFSAYGVSEAGQKNYFQSQDRLRIEFTAEEESGLTILLNPRGLVDNAEINHPESSLTRNLGDGWQVFTEDSCTRYAENERLWKCVIETDSLKSGTGRDVDLKIKIRDTAGNQAEKWPDANKIKNLKGTTGDNFKFTLLGLSTEENPDHWDVGTRTPLLPFIDLDTVNIFPARIPIEVNLKRTTATAQILNLELPEGACRAKEGQQNAPKVNRNLIIKRINPEGSDIGKPTFVLEFKPFDPALIVKKEGDFHKIEFEYNCNLQIFSKIGREALRAAETQQVPLTVTFAYSELGSFDENVDAKVQGLKDDAFFKFASTISGLNDVIKWVQFITGFINIVYGIVSIVTVFKGGLNAAGSTAEKIPFGQAVGNVLKGTCVTMDTIDIPFTKVVEFVQGVSMIFSCNPGASNPGNVDGGGEGILPIGWLYYWQKAILTTYNVGSGRDLLGIEATSLYENLYVSVLGLCIPGILFNIEKARELQCRRIICYQREVPSGIATFDACDRLYDLQMCEFVFGPLFDLTPLGGLAAIGKLIKSAFQSPLGLISIGEIISCSALCWVPDSSVALTICRGTTVLTKALNIVNTIVGGIQSPPSVTSSPYCSQVEELEKSKEKEQKPEQSTEEQPPAPEVQTQG